MKNCLNGSETEKNLLEAFGKESQMSGKYAFYASCAASEGRQKLSEILLDVSRRKLVWAEFFYGLFNDVNEGTLKNIVDSLKAEHDEMKRSLDSFSQTASNEGFLDIADSLSEVGSVEHKLHEKTIDEFSGLTDNGMTETKNREWPNWICVSCKYMHTGFDAPDECPLCKLQKKFFILARRECNSSQIMSIH